MAAESITLKVKGMSCGHCQNAVEKALTEINGVEKAEVSLEEGVAVISYHAGEAALEDFKNAIEEAGYETE